MRVPSTLYTLSNKDGLFAGAVSRASVKPSSVVFGFETIKHTVHVSSLLNRKHRAVIKNKNTVILVPPKSKREVDVNNDLEIAKMDVHELLAFTYLNNTRLFIVNRILSIPEGDKTLLITNSSPFEIEIDQDLAVAQLEELYEV